MPLYVISRNAPDAPCDIRGFVAITPRGTVSGWAFADEIERRQILEFARVRLHAIDRFLRGCGYRVDVYGPGHTPYAVAHAEAIALAA